MHGKTIGNDIRKLHVIGTTGVAVRLGNGTDAERDRRRRLVPATSRSYRDGVELVELPDVIGVARRPLWTTAAIQTVQAPSAA